MASAPYLGGGHRVGIQKQAWNTTLYGAGTAPGLLRPGRHRPSADVTGWKNLTDTGGPFDGNPAATNMVTELTANHSALYIDDSIPPAPVLLANGWNDDLFPVDESLRYYNKVRAKDPNTPISMFHLDFGHSPRAGTISTADRTRSSPPRTRGWTIYVKGVGVGAGDARGGVDIFTSKCLVSAPASRFHAPTWSQLAPGEVGRQRPAQNDHRRGTVLVNCSPVRDVWTTIRDRRQRLPR